MKKRTKILFPTDFSAPAKQAFQYALLLADKIDADILVLHVVYPQAESLDFPVLVAQASKTRVESASKDLKTFVQKGSEQMEKYLSKPLDTHTDLLVGAPIEAITNTVSREDIHLIVMGTKGQHSRMDRFLGSTAEGVANRANCPVLLVPENTPLTLANKVMYATDMLEADPFEIWKMTKLLNQLKLDIHCIHFNFKNNGYAVNEKLEELTDFFKENGKIDNILFKQTRADNLIDGINEYVGTKKMDMIAMLQPKRSFFDKLFHRSQIKKMTFETKVPLLVLKEGV